MTDGEKLDLVIAELSSIKQELKGFNGTPGLCRRVSNLEKIVRRIVYALCLVGGGGGLTAVINKLTGG